MVWHKSSSTVQGDEIINFGGQEVKRQGYTTPKLHLETWQRHHSRPIGSSRFSSKLSIIKECVLTNDVKILHCFFLCFCLHHKIL